MQNPRRINTHRQFRPRIDIRGEPVCSISLSLKCDEVQGWMPSQVYQSQTELFRQDTPAQIIFLIETGIVQLSCSDSSGNEVLVGLRRRDWLLGVPSVLLGGPHITTGTTLTRCTLRSISAKRFLDLLRTDVYLSTYICQLLSRELCKQVTETILARSQPAHQRLRALFIELITEQGITEHDGPMTIELPFKHKDIAQMINVTPEYLCRLLNKLCDEGCVKRSGTSFIITDPHAFLDSPAC